MYRKYNSKKTELDGITFASRKEAARYAELKLLEKAGQISGLALQVPFELLPKTKDERGVKYVADFVYRQNGKTVAEDVKGCKTREYILKRKLFKLIYPEIEFRET